MSKALWCFWCMCHPCMLLPETEWAEPCRRSWLSPILSVLDNKGTPTVAHSLQRSRSKGVIFTLYIAQWIWTGIRGNSKIVLDSIWESRSLQIGLSAHPREIITQGFPVIAASGSYSLTWCHRLLTVAAQGDPLSFILCIFLSPRQHKDDRGKEKTTGNRYWKRSQKAQACR